MIEKPPPWEALLLAVQLSKETLARKFPPGGPIEEHLRYHLAGLAEEERKVLTLRFGLQGEKPRTLAETAAAKPHKVGYVKYFCPQCGSRWEDNTYYGKGCPGYAPRGLFLHARSTKCVQGHTFREPRSETVPAGTPITCERVRQIQARALRRLRAHLSQVKDPKPRGGKA